MISKKLNFPNSVIAKKLFENKQFKPFVMGYNDGYEKSLILRYHFDDLFFIDIELRNKKRITSSFYPPNSSTFAIGRSSRWDAETNRIIEFPLFYIHGKHGTKSYCMESEWDMSISDHIHESTIIIFDDNAEDQVFEQLFFIMN